MENQLSPEEQKLTKDLKEKEEVLKLALLEKAVAQGKFEISSDVLHDIGNAIVGFGSYLTRIKRSLEQNNLDNLQSLASFFTVQQPAMATVLGEAKASAVVSMLGSITLAQKNTQEEVQKSITEQLNIISHVQEILNIQRQYVAGQETHEKSTANLRSILRDCLSMLFASIDKRAIIVTSNISVESPVIEGERTKLMQVIMNLIKNSIEAIDMNAAEKTISIRLYKDNDLLILEIKDSGNGFDKVTGDRLFERGFTTKSSGTGLGLNNCKAIIESHEGTISIASDGRGKGALTTIKLKN
ncbi:MAG TPA: HAMP domain-containing sensor histidine kinase [Puia sp.]|nr:HAMP domain-containing sensor histidine kinase [Puia sp.]